MVRAKLNYQPLPPFVLLQTSKLTGHYQSGDDGLTKCVRLYFFGLLRKSLLKLNNRSFLTAVTRWDITCKIFRFTPKPYKF